MELKFEWDEEKDRINRQKHGISFETASYVFRDEYYIEMYDFEHSYGRRPLYCNRYGWRFIVCCIYRAWGEYPAELRKIGNRK